MELKAIQIPSKMTHEWVKKKHYAHRIPPISYAFGLYDGTEIVGICTYGIPMGASLKRGICGVEYENIVLELNRLCLNDGLPKNTASNFISQTFKLLPKPSILVSYADTGQNHTGYIYQATNWIYTGLGAGGSSWAVKGLENLHHITIEDSVGRYEDRDDEFTLEELLKKKYGEKLYRKSESKKHRYIYFLGNKREREQTYLAN